MPDLLLIFVIKNVKLYPRDQFRVFLSLVLREKCPYLGFFWSVCSHMQTLLLHLLHWHTNFMRVIATEYILDLKLSETVNKNSAKFVFVLYS